MIPKITKKPGKKINAFAAFCCSTIFCLVFSSTGFTLELSNEELAYLRAKNTIIFVSQRQYPPFEFVDANGQQDGMMRDIIRWIAVEVGFKPVFMDRTFQQAQEAVLAGEADIITSLFYSDKRKEKFEFTRPLFDVPASLFIQAERTDIKDINDLNGKMIAMQKGDYAKEFLESKKTHFFTLMTKDFSEATSRVLAGQADVVIGDEQIVFYHIFSNQLTGSIKKVGEPLYIGKNCMASNRNNGLLINILNKGINEAIRNGQLNKIETKWLGTKINSPERSLLDQYRWHVGAGVGGILLLLSLVWIWNIRLRILVQKKTADITLREEALTESEETYRSILNASPDDITIADLEGRILMVSPAAVKVFGYNDIAEGTGMRILDFILPEEHELARSNIMSMFQGGYSGPHEYTGIKMDGTLFDIEVNSGLVRNAKGQPTKMVLIVRDITERKQAEQQIQQLIQQLEVERNAAQLNAVTDSLTGLANRRYFDEAIRTEFYRLKRSGAPLSLIMLDVDHFKNFNDLYGHLAGDNCLRLIAATLKTVVGRVPDVVARFGGEEFVIILPETDRNGAIFLAESIRKAVAELAISHEKSETASHVTVSLGVVTTSSVTDAVTPDQIVAMADTALYSAKNGGRNCYVYFVKNPDS